MTPYYEDDAVTIYHGDSFDLLPALRPGSVQAFITDPPYVIGAVSAGNMASKAGGWQDMMNSASWFAGWYKLVDRALSASGVFWSFCNWRSLPVVMRAAVDAADADHIRGRVGQGVDRPPAAHKGYAHRMN